MNREQTIAFASLAQLYMDLGASGSDEAIASAYEMLATLSILFTLAPPQVVYPSFSPQNLKDIGSYLK